MCQTTTKAIFFLDTPEHFLNVCVPICQNRQTNMLQKESSFIALQGVVNVFVYTIPSEIRALDMNVHLRTKTFWVAKH